MLLLLRVLNYSPYLPLLQTEEKNEILKASLSTRVLHTKIICKKYKLLVGTSQNYRPCIYVETCPKFFNVLWEFSLTICHFLESRNRCTLWKGEKFLPNFLIHLKLNWTTILRNWRGTSSWQEGEEWQENEGTHLWRNRGALVKSRAPHLPHHIELLWVWGICGG